MCVCAQLSTWIKEEMRHLTSIGAFISVAFTSIYSVHVICDFGIIFGRKSTEAAVGTLLR